MVAAEALVASGILTFTLNAMTTVMSKLFCAVRSVVFDCAPISSALTSMLIEVH